jgi:hypothetical protein
MPAAAYRPVLRVALSVTSLALASAWASAAAASSTRASNGGTQAAIANIRRSSTWAYPEQGAAAHRRPSADSQTVGRLSFLTGDGQAQLYLELGRRVAGGVEWILVELPGRPNGRSGWVRRSALGEMHVTNEDLRIDRERLQATLYRAGREIWSAPVGMGRPGDPTPSGLFYVTEKLTAIGGPFYGPFALGTSAYAPTLSEWPGGGVVGIHGTDEPQLIPGRPSHGCIRLRNNDIRRLWPLIGVGTPIEIV